MTTAKREFAEPPRRTRGKRGGIADSEVENLHLTFTSCETEILRFKRNSDVAFTKDRPERDVRMAKIKQTVSGCTRSPKDAAANLRTSSHLECMGYEGYNPLAAIGMTLVGNAEEPIGNEPLGPAEGARAVT